ncbi:MAG: PhzF family phenazine biosynthesis protein [Blastocatellia bacterium]|nr:PhzF family phenazine biosynthesis protein [Blastocatellia bacterium]MCS7156471.1 PhzF family phenazine biosynthesis protein [Blastocatellia bacterium]MCX7751788.1 PhzF family phenazine biosynthesis protein [Blastocatellia bacterium]MDW8168890.1 PhzF family phenazine biosynthesis protein [Acidobacteriota bacterium]MDW8256650.1 PhzF family phenazine biosynthesis protein [Acidobacteriota bacterium]
MGTPIFQVNAFTEVPFSGNPAAVCVLSEPRDAPWMQRVAREMNLSETAFLWPGEGGFHLRWFTPTVEVELCGHATLASAHILWTEGYVAAREQIRFFTRSGVLTAARRDEWIELDFPATPAEPTEAPPRLQESLGVTPRFVGRSCFDYLVEVESEDVLRQLAPNFALLETIPTRGVIVTSRSTTLPFDFVSRFFAPRVGVPEDPVTGSAHCCLGPFWGQRLGRTELLAYQASARGGVIRIRLANDRVILGGQAVTMWRGHLLW